MDELPDIFLREQLALRLEREISSQIDEIIGTKILPLVKKFSIATKDKKSPFRNVLAVATESNSSLEVIKNYIRYQVGRKESSPIWKTSMDNELFAKAVVNDLNNLSQDAHQIVERLRRASPKGNSLELYLENNQNREKLEKNIHLKLAQLYLGYLAREHTASVGESKSN